MSRGRGGRGRDGGNALLAAWWRTSLGEVKRRRVSACFRGSMHGLAAGLGMHRLAPREQAVALKWLHPPEGWRTGRLRATAKVAGGASHGVLSRKAAVVSSSSASGSKGGTRGACSPYERQQWCWVVADKRSAPKAEQLQRPQAILFNDLGTWFRARCIWRSRLVSTFSSLRARKVDVVAEQDRG